eukprot:c3510_g1_i1.p1 GENE.c3510_g1_i1~~c3510_g1_i1.p1  ORF type:complete len:486 (-),score=130.77 c3510_g1_i1:117-1574(-)
METQGENGVYDNPLVTRYASKEMSFLWSPQFKFSTWRKLWIALAETEKELGLNITQEQIDEMKSHIHDIDFEKAAKYEKETRHDVMAHVKTFADACPAARPIIHLGATSCYVGDNGDLIAMRESLVLVRASLARLIHAMSSFASLWKSQPTLGFTHYQPAQPTTVGKRTCLWLQDFLMDLENIQSQIEKLPFRGAKGTTGTQASFMSLFNNDHAKVRQLDEVVTAKMGFNRRLLVTGQTYTRKIDSLVMNVLADISGSAHKFAVDLRLLMNLKEIEEPFESTQIGSSAMPYKRNPMRAERVCSLARFVMNLAANAHQTHAQQWMERTLDDSANRRLSLPQAFLATDAILTICLNIFRGMVVWPKVIERHLALELPFMATEDIMMECVKAGGDRQELHEKIRVHSHAAGRVVKDQGSDNDLLQRLAADPAFAAVANRLSEFTDPQKFVGRAPQQVDDFIEQEVKPVLAQMAGLGINTVGGDAVLHV